MAGNLRKAFDATVSSSSEVVSGVDDAVVEVGRTIAEQIDYAVENLEGEAVTKALYLAPHLMNVLKEMLATPAARKAAGIAGEDGKDGNVPSALGRLRLAHGSKAG